VTSLDAPSRTVWSGRHDRAPATRPGAARQGDFFAVLINDKFCLAVVFQNSPHVSDIVEQAGDNKMSIVVGSMRSHIIRPRRISRPDESDKDRMFEVMIKGIAPTEAFDGAAGERAKSLGNVLMPEPNTSRKSLLTNCRETGNHLRDRLHRYQLR